MKKIKIALTCFVLIVLINMYYPNKQALTTTPPSTTLSIDDQATRGENGWYISAIQVSLFASPGSHPIEKITHWINEESPNISTNNPTTKTLITQGEHRLNYFATDKNNTHEATKSFDYKIDVVAPSAWSGFTLTREGNNHTFSIKVNVTDKTSGLNPTSAQFQYSVDRGTTWGYYSNLLACNSTWNNNQWRNAELTPNTQGIKTATINIPKTDYCNSNWSETKYIRIRLKDMAGLTSTKQYALMSPWITTSNGDIYSAGGYDMITEQGTSNDGVIINATEMQNNMTSSKGWNVANYPLTNTGLYNEYYSLIGNKAIRLPTQFPTSSGIYTTNSYSLTSIPNALRNAQNIAIIVFVNGDLFIDTNVSLQKNSSIVWIVSGNIGIKDNITQADGIYLADGSFSTSYNRNSDAQLTINGSIVANGGITLVRSLKNNDNLTKPAEIINLTSSIYVNNTLLNQLRANPSIIWKEYITY